MKYLMFFFIIILESGCMYKFKVLFTWLGKAKTLEIPHSTGSKARPQSARSSSAVTSTVTSAQVVDWTIRLQLVSNIL